LNKPKISAILPCYNHAAFLEERIQSVLNQTLPVSQIIFLDDASNDGSLELARKLLVHSPVEVEFHSNACNTGSPFAQWNKGLRLAKHPYVWIAETDDSCKPHLLAELFARLSTSGTVIAFSQSLYIDASGKVLGSPHGWSDAHWPGFFAQDFMASGFEFNLKFMTVINVIPNASAVLFNRSALGLMAAANEAMQFCGDWDFWIRIAEQGQVAYVAEQLNNFRCHQHTTRVKHHVHEATAEFLACRLRALFANPGSTPRIGLSRLVKLFRQRSQYDISLLQDLLVWGSFWKVYSCYRRLPDVPYVSLGAWSVTALFSFNKYLRQKFVNLKRRAFCFADSVFLDR
jgi:glycosyltransferase involved in cell wall biosynthesis